VSAIPQVSVLVTVFNREAFLRECLDSILASSFDDFEVIVVDDASTDKSVDIAREFAQADARVKVFVNERNLGDYPNRNRAASHASGKYLKYLDADDKIYSHALSVMVAGMEAHPDAALGLSWNIIDPPREFPFVSSPRDAYVSHFLGTSVFGVGPSASIISRAAFEEVGGFSGRQFVGDAELWMRLAERWPVVSFPPALVWWRRHPAQESVAEKSDTNLLSVRYDMEMATLEITSLLTSAEKKKAAMRIRRRFVRRLLSLAVREGRPAEALGGWRRAKLGVGDFVNAVSRRAESVMDLRTHES
jgi:glycosyltransferase involved in cell wall biosynthesis